jgi:hypothetical protein
MSFLLSFPPSHLSSFLPSFLASLPSFPPSLLPPFLPFLLPSSFPPSSLPSFLPSFYLPLSLSLSLCCSLSLSVALSRSPSFLTGPDFVIQSGLNSWESPSVRILGVTHHAWLLVGLSTFYQAFLSLLHWGSQWDFDSRKEWPPAVHS